MPRTASVSPPPRHPKLDDDYDPDFDHPVGPHFGRGFRGGRGGGRFRDVSPHDGFGRDGRSIGRGYMSDRCGSSPSGGEYVHRNDPNLSPREGDWICGNPRCGNLNFARRTYCNNCHKPRFAPGHFGLSGSPQRDYFTSPPPYGSPPSFPDAALDRGFQRETSSYRSPPHGWGSEVSRDFWMGSPPPRHAGGRFQDRMRRDDSLDYEDDYWGRGKFDWPVADDWDQRDGHIPGRRGYDRRLTSSRDRWVHESRDRSRSPLGVRPVKGSYMGIWVECEIIDAMMIHTWEGAVQMSHMLVAGDSIVRMILSLTEAEVIDEALLVGGSMVIGTSSGQSNNFCGNVC